MALTPFNDAERAAASMAYAAIKADTATLNTLRGYLTTALATCGVPSMPADRRDALLAYALEQVIGVPPTGIAR